MTDVLAGMGSRPVVGLRLLERPTDPAAKPLPACDGVGHVGASVILARGTGGCFPTGTWIMPPRRSDIIRNGNSFICEIFLMFFRHALRSKRYVASGDALGVT